MAVDALERVAEALERVAEALERAHPPEDVVLVDDLMREIEGGVGDVEDD